MEPKAIEGEVDETLKLYAVKRIIVDHAIVSRNVGFYFGARMLRLDVDAHKQVHRATHFKNGMRYKTDNKVLRAELKSNNADLVSSLCPEKRLYAGFLVLLEQNYKSERGALFYCDGLNVSYYYLNLVCRNQAGRSVTELVHLRLLAECRLLLVSTRMRIKNIAYELGFSDPSNFNRFFRRHAGVSPFEFRKGNRAGGDGWGF